MSATPDANPVEARRWLRQAEQQLAVAHYNAAGRFWPTACFLYQQAAEIALKSLLIRRGKRARVHGLLHLVERLVEDDQSAERLSEPARQLDRFYVTTRYPDALPTGISDEYFDEHDAVSAKTAAEQILATVRQELGKTEP